MMDAYWIGWIVGVVPAMAIIVWQERNHYREYKAAKDLIHSSQKNRILSDQIISDLKNECVRLRAELAKYKRPRGAGGRFLKKGTGQ